MNDDFVLNVKNLDVYFGDNRAINDVSSDIHRNKITAIIGPSGCGKTTLLRSLNRMNDLTPCCRVEGEVIYEGRNIYSEDTDVVSLREEIGMVFQKPNPFPKSIYENVAYGPKVNGIKSSEKLNNIVEKSLKRAALWDEVKDRLDDSAMGLSGGQQQRLCIARALAVEPEVVLMDEPTSSLDPIATSKIEDLIQDLKENYTVVIVSHNMQQAARVSDYTLFLYLGELIEYSETDKMFENPEKEKTENYITGRFG